MEAIVSSAIGTAPFGCGGQARRRGANTTSRRFDSWAFARHQRTVTLFTHGIKSQRSSSWG